MKKFRMLMVIGILLIASATVRADVILPNTHIVQRCAEIQNTDSFPDIAVIGYSNFGNSADIRYIVQKDSCLYKGYKFSSFYLLWTLKTYFDSVGLANLPLQVFVQGLSKKINSSSDQPVEPVHLLSSDVSPLGATVPDSDLLTSEELFYKLYARNSSISLYLAKNISHFSDNTSKTDTFSQPTRVVQAPRQVLIKNPFETIVIQKGLFTFKTDFNGTLTIALSDCQGRAVSRYFKSCKPGCTYVIDLAGRKSGLYWMRLTSPHADVLKRLTIIR